MNFTADPEVQWDFILIALRLADTNEHLAILGAGPLEHLLGWHGPDYIERVEAEAARDTKFARALTGVWRYLMTPEVWERVQAARAHVDDPL